MTLVIPGTDSEKGITATLVDFLTQRLYRNASSLGDRVRQPWNYSARSLPVVPDTMEGIPDYWTRVVSEALNLLTLRLTQARVRIEDR